MIDIKDLMAYTSDRKLRAGSNNWAVSPALSASGKAILSGDPHLDPRILPGVFYPVGLITPEIRAVGANIPGMPAMAIGRTDEDYVRKLVQPYSDRHLWNTMQDNGYSLIEKNFSPQTARRVVQYLLKRGQQG